MKQNSGLFSASLLNINMIYNLKSLLFKNMTLLSNNKIICLTDCSRIKVIL